MNNIGISFFFCWFVCEWETFVEVYVQMSTIFLDGAFQKPKCPANSILNSSHGKYFRKRR